MGLDIQSRGIRKRHGFFCPYCQAPATFVRFTKPGNPYKRYRKCRECKKAFRTLESHVETEADDYINIIAGFASEKLAERFMRDIVDILTSTSVRDALARKLKKRAGVNKKTKDARCLFR